MKIIKTKEIEEGLLGCGLVLVNYQASNFGKHKAMR